MELQKNWERPKQIADPDYDPDKIKDLKLYPDNFTGIVFNAVVREAITRIVNFKPDANGLVAQGEKLDLVFELLTTRGGFKYRHTLWGARKKPNEDWGANPVAMQDFLFVASQQKPNCCEHYSASGDYGDFDVYPHLAGVKVKIVLAKIGEREYKGKFYDKDYVAIFAPDGRSALEIQTGITGADVHDMQNALNDAKARYEKWKAEFAPQNVPQDSNPYGSMNNVTTAAPVQTAAPVNNTAAKPDDDIPF